MFTFEELCERRLPHLDRSALPLEALRRAARSSDFDWLASAAELIPPSEPSRLAVAAANAEAERAPPEGAEAATTLQLGPYTLHYQADALSLLDSFPDTATERFALDVAHFGGPPDGGQPTLEVTPTGGGVDVVFADAYYPGTLIPASLKFRIREIGGQWTLRLRLRYGGFDATLPLADWLTGAAPAVSLVRPDFEACPLGASSQLEIRGPGFAAFTPAWGLATLGLDIHRFTGFGDSDSSGPDFGDPGTTSQVTADLSLVGLLPPGAPALLLPNNLRRTIVFLASDSEFPLEPELSQPGPRVHLGAFAFDSLALEAGLGSDPNTSDQALRLLYAQSTDDPTVAGLEPGADLLDGSGEPFRAPISDPRYVQLFDHERVRTLAALVAETANRPTWMHTRGISLLLSRAPQAPNVGVLVLQGQDPLVILSLALLKTAARVEGMLVRPEPAPRRAEMLFTWGPLITQLPPERGHVEMAVEIDPVVPGVPARILLPLNTSIATVRRDDFLVLAFRWLNFRLETRGADRRLLPGSGEESHLLVELPPQSVGEEAFFEVDEDYDVDDSDMDGDKKALPVQNVPDPPSPPVKALLAKSSRLVFSLPESWSELPVTADTLLDWHVLEPSLAPTALPGRIRLGVLDKVPVLLPGPALDLIQKAKPRVVGAGLPSGQPSGLQPATALDRFVPTSFVAGPARRPATGSSTGLVLGNQRPLDVFKVPSLEPLVPAAPTAATTRIEIPFRLLLSPNGFGAWVHSKSPVTRGDRTELWHTRLGTRSGGAVVDGPHLHRTVRAIWSRDFEHEVQFDQPFLMPLDWNDRWQLVRLTSEYTNFLPKPVTVNRLMLSALGGWLDSDYRHPPPPPGQNLSIEQWRHRATQGRDHYVRVVYKGFFFPVGHRASLIKISERKVELTPEGDPAAYIRQRMFLVIREPEKLNQGPGYEFDGREIPLRRIRITTEVTPNLDPPANTPMGSALNPPMKRFWPQVGGQDFLFHLKGWDWENNEIDFLMPLAFVRSDALDDQNEIGQAVDAYNDAAEARRTVSLEGQPVAYAETEGSGGYAGKTSFETVSVRFQALAPHNATLEPPCYPKLEIADLAVASMRQMTGGDTPARMEIHPEYLQHRFGAGNPGGVFARVPQGEAEVSLDYKTAGSADRAGGVATPSLVIRGLSRELGTVGDASSSLAQGNFDPGAFFSGIDADLLGGISLSDILGTLGPGDFLQKAPKLVTVKRPEEITTTLSFKTDALVPSSAFEPRGSQLTLESVLRTDKNGGSLTSTPGGTLEGVVTDFTINLAGVVEVDFAEFRFTSKDGKKPDVHAVVTDVRFAGPLEFLAKLQDILSPENFVDPPFVDVDTQGVTVGFNLTIPTVAVGVFALANLALGARLALPFDGDPMRLRFNLSERPSPFTVSVGPFGGGGFFALEVGLDGVERLEALLEFGGSMSIDLGVASGGIYLMAGIYLEIEVATEKSALTGYVRAGGSLSVMGIVTISIELYLGLEYDFGNGKAWGEASVTVEIEVLLFSGSVTVTMRRQFAGSEGDPPFGILMPQPRWSAYAAAFA